MLTKSFTKDPLGLRWYGAALLYAVAMYALGFAGLFATSWTVNALAAFVLAHGMIIAAYLVHECAHNLVFRRNRHNARLGRFLSWLCGAAYGTYEHDLIMHGVMMLTSFVIPQRRDQRVRNVSVIAIRGGIFLALLVFVPKVALLYVVAYLLVIHVLRFMDSVQHDYGYNTTLFEYVDPPRKGDTAWEQAHTFSNPLSLRSPKLNLLVLNFGYHNAHHADMNAPFFRLPALHEKLTGNDATRVVPFLAQLKLYHRNRVRRVCNEQPDDYPKGEAYLAAARTGRAAIGGNAASFLTSF
jgi:fatty acid desaturase